jgi:murein DD-endopeptidase MepM/ murein hydrolase activator NlpD
MAGIGRGRGRTFAVAALSAILWLTIAVPAALAQESPSATAEPTVSVEPSPSPSPSATETATPTPTSTPTETSSSSPTPAESTLPTTSPTPTSSGTGGTGHQTPILGAPGGGASGQRNNRQNGTTRHHLSGKQRWKDWTPSTAGAWSTRILDKAAAEARRKGWSTARIAAEIYAPFPVMGPATWTDTWGAPRFDGGYHPHAGQDVLCVWGTPVMAIEDGTVTYGWNALGGQVAYLSLSDGSFWYYAHLSRTRPSLDGTDVDQGQIIGNCGATGDASVPHLHFGFETAEGVMLDPLHALRVSLHLAEVGLTEPSANNTIDRSRNRTPPPRYRRCGRESPSSWVRSRQLPRARISRRPRSAWRPASSSRSGS